MNARISQLLTLLASALLVAPGPGEAAEGRIPIPFASPVSFPIVIDAGGSYVLTRELVSTVGTGPILHVTSPDPVRIDLNHMSLTGVTAGPVIAIDPAATNVEIRNGILKGGSDGVTATSPTWLVLEDLVIEGPASSCVRATSVQQTVEISGCRCLTPGSDGIFLQGDAAGALPQSATVADSTIVSAGESGVIVSEFKGTALITRNKLLTWGRTCPTCFGIDFTSSSVGGPNVISHNTATSEAGFFAISTAGSSTRASGISVEYNNLSSTNGGIHATAAKQLILGNQVILSRQDGIHLTSTAGGCILRDNNVINCDGWGIYVYFVPVVQQQCTLIGNALAGNLGVNVTSSRFCGTQLRPQLCGIDPTMLRGWDGSIDWLDR